MSKESSQNGDDESATDYQLGVHDINRSPSLDKEGEFIEFDYETAAVFKRLADDIYESVEAGIREPLQNSLTAVRRAEAETNLQKGDNVVEIEVHDGEKTQVVLEDNGLGISRDVLQDVLAVIGRSTNRDDGGVSGKYGMGFLACYKLVGTDGGFVMYTNARKTNEPPLQGIWKPGGFEVDNSGKLPQRFDEDDYGTRFEFTLETNAGPDKVSSWVEKHAEWSRVPILYREYDKNGRLVNDDEYGVKELADEHNDALFELTIDNDYFTAICSPEANKRTLLLNSPLDRNSEYYDDAAPASIDIRLKNENGVVVDGPHEGLMPASDAEYEDMEAERREDYVAESALSDDDLALPKPTGTRDTLERNTEFWAYLHETFKERYKQEIASTLESLDTTDDFDALSVIEKKKLHNAVSRLSLHQGVQSGVVSTLGVTVPDGVGARIDGLRKRVWLVERNASARNARTKRGSGSRKRAVIDVLESADGDGDIFMGVSLNQTKMDAVWDAGENNQVVRIEDSDSYSTLTNLFGWKKLKNVTDMVDELDLSESMESRLTSSNKSTTSSSTSSHNAGLPPEEREITLHSAGSQQGGLRVEDIYETFEDNDEYLVLFPSNAEENLSDHYHLKAENVSIANCIVKVADYLSDLDNVVRIEEWEDKVKSLEYETNRGTMNVEDAVKSDTPLVLHQLDSSVVSAFKQTNIMDEMTTILDEDNNHFGRRSKLSNISQNNVIYLPVSVKEMDIIRYFFPDDSQHKSFLLQGDAIGGSATMTTERPAGSDLYWYMWCKLPEWRNSEELRTINERGFTLTTELIGVVDTMAESEYTLASLSGIEKTPPTEVISFDTSAGHKTLKEMCEEHEAIAFHILPTATVDLFTDADTAEQAKEYIYRNADASRNSRHTADEWERDEIVYAPVTKDEYTSANRFLNRDTHFTISGDKYWAASDMNVENDTAVYGFARLPQSVYEVVLPQTNRNALPQLSSNGAELIESFKRGTTR